LLITSLQNTGTMKIRAFYLGFAGILLILFSAGNSIGNTLDRPDSTDFYSDNFVRNSDYVYQSNIRSVEMGRVGFELADPIITLGTGERLTVDFDDLNGNFRQYYFTVVHCNADWEKSDIWVNEYLEGADQDQVETYEPSFNTRTPYSHYSFVFPNDRLIIKKSGNYILRVWSEDGRGNPVTAFTRRFLVVDPRVTVSAKISRAGTSEDYETRQEVDFTVQTTGYRIDSPYQDIHVVVLQNWRWDNANYNLKPYMVRNEVLDYSYDNGLNLFDGLNEFRRFDLKSMKFISERVREISFDDTMFYVKLWDSERRTFKEYAVDDDINGRFLLKTTDATSVNNEGEYARVKFFLPWEAPIVEGNLYVAGGFNGWQYTPENKMEYNYRRKGYEADILFKQGYYNFMYVMLPNHSSVGDATWVEGNHSETRNLYTILVYHRAKGELFDELIGSGTFESRK
jgi:hypothetical protein